MSEFGKVGCATVSELSNNLIGMNAVKVLNKKQITIDVCINALSYLMFLKRKRTSDIKARGCVATIHILCYGCNGIEACNIPGVFLQANWPEDNDCYLKFEVLMVKMICETDPNYLKYVLTNKRTGSRSCMVNSPSRFVILYWEQYCSTRS